MFRDSFKDRIGIEIPNSDTHDLLHFQTFKNILDKIKLRKNVYSRGQNNV